MAFLCPSRRGRQKKKHKEPKPPFIGRITGSSSVDTLVRVGLEKQHGLTPDARVSVAQDFLATTSGELSARRGDHVYRLYEEGDWVYVITELGQEGFIPAICLAIVDGVTGNKSKKRDVILHEPRVDNPGFEKTTPDGGKYARQHSNPSARYNVRNAELEKGFNTSMLADEGSDISSSHSPIALRHQINPLPKPARTLSIPDVVSTTSDSINVDNSNNNNNKQSAIVVDKKTKYKTPSSTTNSNDNNDSSNNSKTVRNSSKQHQHHDKYDNSNKLYHDRARQSGSSGAATANILELPLMKAGARDSHTSNGDSITEVKTFVKKPGRKIVVVFPFLAPEENDLKVRKGEVVMVLNEKDPDWVWVRTKNGNEGFVPKAFTCSIPDDLLKTDVHSEVKYIAVAATTPQHPKATKSRASNYHDVRELVTHRSFEAQSSDDISVKSGEQVFADLANQIEEDWLWVYAPTSQSYGYIPKHNVKWRPNSTMQQTCAMDSNNIVKQNVGKPV